MTETQYDMHEYTCHLPWYWFRHPGVPGNQWVQLVAGGLVSLTMLWTAVRRCVNYFGHSCEQGGFPYFGLVSCLTSELLRLKGLSANAAISARSGGSNGLQSKGLNEGSERGGALE